MTTNEIETGEKLDRLNANLAKVEALSLKLAEVMARHKPLRNELNAPEPEVFVNAATAYWQGMMENPGKILENQLDLWSKSVKSFVDAQNLILKGQFAAPQDDTPTDRRFSHHFWQDHPYFNMLKQQYMRNAEAIKIAVSELEGLSAKDKQRIDYFSRQIIDMMSPTNFLGTNPEALERAVETEGQSLVDGLENLIADLDANNGELLVKLADESAFEIGGNIATAPGKVVYRNRLFELLQFSPTTDTVYEVPLVIFPPWINKYYILDLKEQNSLIRWAVAQGYTVFVVSWVNPDRSLADVGLDDYIEEGFLEAIAQIKEISGQPQINAVGYCIAGTTLHLTLSLMKKRGDDSLKSATFFTTLTDFGEQGEFTPFLQNDFIDGIDEEVAEEGILRSFIMQRTFSFLRSNDLIYTPAIKSYMMGEAPPAFDLLYWNGDGSGLPGKMAHQYLRDLCQSNKFVGEGLQMCGETLKISDVDIPTCSVTCETDHIARWKDCYCGYQQTKSRSKTFIVSQSGHIAGIVNPPSKKKYGHYTNTKLSLSADEWMEQATFHEGSWWPRWDAWLSKKSGKHIEARMPGTASHPALGDAPGDYVRKKALK
ncbi:class I poly(R)-hydroxyalkanoic acid synthase [Shimia sp. R10_1]|uniref:PHA/PHB synthase family protein n=1 Tax=Shimia sp. R10_1 TaxID=2821095 RepID=UPI001AD9A1FA|nr:class I poly(R)-hydroxyalkanoic acid synthase [Shimia sp. R10_1]MBO9473461.1 class I poly(R)-hydroxyalkanoic acid synthase [Shimia sp. R10_1]